MQTLVGWRPYVWTTLGAVAFLFTVFDNHAPAFAHPEDSVADHDPKDMDAMAAAPDHHKRLLENETVRVLETCVEPGERTNLHSHGWPAVQYVMSWNDIVRRDAEGKIVADSRNWKQPAAPGLAQWSDNSDVHSIENVGSNTLCVLVMEVKDQDGEPNVTPIL